MICRKLFKDGLTSIFSVFRIPHGDKSSVQGFQSSVLKFCRLQSASFEVSSLLFVLKSNIDNGTSRSRNNKCTVTRLHRASAQLTQRADSGNVFNTSYQSGSPLRMAVVRGRATRSAKLCGPQAPRLPITTAMP
mgnify:CR=1 FL=1